MELIEDRDLGRSPTDFLEPELDFDLTDPLEALDAEWTPVRWADLVFSFDFFLTHFLLSLLPLFAMTLSLV